MALCYKIQKCEAYNESVVVEWFKELDWRCEGRGFKSRHGTNILWQDINLLLLLSTQVLNGQVTPGWYAPQGVESGSGKH